MKRGTNRGGKISSRARRSADWPRAVITIARGKVGAAACTSGCPTRPKSRRHRVNIPLSGSPARWRRRPRRLADDNFRHTGRGRPAITLVGTVLRAGLPYKQGVGGSSPPAPTLVRQRSDSDTAQKSRRSSRVHRADRFAASDGLMVCVAACEWMLGAPARIAGGRHCGRRVRVARANALLVCDCCHRTEGSGAVPCSCRPCPRSVLWGCDPALGHPRRDSRATFTRT